jgi:thioredoxin reductase (NADPH)
MKECPVCEGIIFEPRQKYPGVPNSNKKYDVIVVGAGMAGYAATMYCGRLGLSVLCIGEVPGGTVGLTSEIENYPGFVSINGGRLASLLESHARDYHSDFLTDIAEDISFDRKKEEFTVVSGESKFFSKSVIFATGAKVRKLNIPGEDEFFGKGVSYCALCDLNQVKGKVAAVAGGGDSAIKEAILLSEHAKKICIINRDRSFRAEATNLKKIEPLVSCGKVEIISDNEAVKLEGNERLEKIILKNPYKGQNRLDVDGLFIYVGRDPKSSLAKKAGVKVNSKGEVVVDKNCAASLPGFFAAGDVTDNSPKQAITAAADGVRAAYHTYLFCSQRPNH